MDELKSTFESSAIVGNFENLKKSVEEHQCDAIFHAGMIPYNKKELDNLCIDYHDKLSIYEDNKTLIYYFRFGKKEYYEFMPFALSLNELRIKVEYLISSSINTEKEIEGLDKISINELVEFIKPMVVDKPIKYHYKVNLFITKVDINRNDNCETREFKFASGNMILDRRNAVSKAKEILNTIDDYLPEGEYFSSCMVSELLDFRNYNSYSLTISFVDDEYPQFENPIFGSPEEQHEVLYEECYFFKIKYPLIKSTKIEDLNGELVEVLEEDLDFLLEGI